MDEPKIRFVTLNKSLCIAVLERLKEIHSDVSNWDKQHFLIDLPSKWELSVVGFAPDPICYAILSTKFRDRVHIHQFMVHPDFRKEGVGTLLLQEAKVRAAFIANLLSLKVSKHNFEAIKFYERHGFRIELEETEQLNLLLNLKS